MITIPIIKIAMLKCKYYNANNANAKISKLMITPIKDKESETSQMTPSVSLYDKRIMK